MFGGSFINVFIKQKKNLKIYFSTQTKKKRTHLQINTKHFLNNLIHFCFFFSFATFYFSNSYERQTVTLLNSSFLVLFVGFVFISTEHQEQYYIFTL